MTYLAIENVSVSYDGRTRVLDGVSLGVERGELRSDLDIEPTAAVLQEMHLAAAVLHRTGGLSTRQVRRRQAAAMSLVLHGLLAPT